MKKKKELAYKCTNTHDLCYQQGPCPYCEKVLASVRPKSREQVPASS